MKKQLFVATAVLAWLWPAGAEAALIRVTFTNLQPSTGLHFSPVFFASHDGSYDFFDEGKPASPSLEGLAEDGAAGPRIAAARASGKVFEATRALGGPIAPGQSRTVYLNVDPGNPQTRFLSFASMAVPSNDAFIGNDDPQQIPLFNPFGDLIHRSGEDALIIRGTDVWDAGTEVNDEVPETTAFLGQTVANTGADENGVVHSHLGFQGSALFGGPLGNILSAFPGADFTVPGTQVASISVTEAPEPGALALAGFGVLSLLGYGWRRRQSS